MRKNTMLYLLSFTAIVLLAGCNSFYMFEPKEENPEITRIMSEIEESTYEYIDEEFRSDPTVTVFDEKTFNVTIEEFLYRYDNETYERGLEIINEDNSAGGSLAVIVGVEPFLLISFNPDTQQVSSVTCEDLCTEDYQEAILKSLKLKKYQNNKSYLVSNYKDESEFGYYTDVFEVTPK